MAPKRATKQTVRPEVSDVQKQAQPKENVFLFVPNLIGTSCAAHR